jgi:hypothetical protein
MWLGSTTAERLGAGELARTPAGAALRVAGAVRLVGRGESLIFMIWLWPCKYGGQ